MRWSPCGVWPGKPERRPGPTQRSDPLWTDRHDSLAERADCPLGQCEEGLMLNKRIHVAVIGLPRTFSFFSAQPH